MTAALTTAPAAAPNTVHGNGFGSVVAGVVTSCLGAVGVWVGLLAMFGTMRPLHVGWLVPLSGVYLALDPLGGFFVALTGGVAIPVGLYAIGYARREHLGRVPLGVVPVFVAAMLLVGAAGSVTTFLVAWELMALASLILVLAEHARPEVRSAGLMYAVMTQLGFVVILIGLMVLSAAGGADRFAALGRMPDGARIAVFALTGGGAAGDWRRVRAVRGAASHGGHRSQTAACLFDDREHGPDHPRAGGGHAVRRRRRTRPGDHRDGRGDAASGRAR